MDLNRGSLVLEVTDLPTAPQPLPSKCFLWAIVWPDLTVFEDCFSYLLFSFIHSRLFFWQLITSIIPPPHRRPSYLAQSLHFGYRIGKYTCLPISLFHIFECSL